LLPDNSQLALLAALVLQLVERLLQLLLPVQTSS
jgi:hypothetical protein